MEKEKISMKGGKYPQDFQEKLMALSLNADIMSSMVLKKEEVAEEIINIVRDAINKGKKKKAKVHLELIKVQLEWRTQYRYRLYCILPRGKYYIYH